MNVDSHYAFYGSLRRGMSNHEVYKTGLKYLFSARLKGFRLFSMDEYPCATESSDPTNSIVVEIYKIIDPAIEKGIHEMELSVGYYFKNIRIDAYTVGIYLYASSENYPEVIHGDWVDFFRRKQDT